MVVLEVEAEVEVEVEEEADGGEKKCSCENFLLTFPAERAMAQAISQI
jgi:hypothetical protein